MIKFHDDPTVNESQIVIFLRQVWWSMGKREGFKKREKNENEEKKMHVDLKTDLRYCYLYLGYS